MKQYFTIIGLTFFLCSPVLAMDLAGDTVRKRPEKIDTSAQVISSSGVIASYSLSHKIIPLNQIHSWQLTLTDKQGKALEEMQIIFNSTMPEHLHGMTTKPKVTGTGTAGVYQLDGMNFHMPGWWEITLEITGNNLNDVVHFNLLVGESVSRR